MEPMEIYEMVRVQCGEHDGETYRFRATEAQLEEVKDFFFEKYPDDSFSFWETGNEKIYFAKELIEEFK